MLPLGEVLGQGVQCGAEMLAIGQLARAVGDSVRALRLYDNVGLVPATRTARGHRRYQPDDVSHVRRVRALRIVGLYLAEIGEVIDGDDARLAGLVRARRQQPGVRVAELDLARRPLRGVEQGLVHSAWAAWEDILTGLTFTPYQLQRLRARHSTAASTEWVARARKLDAIVSALLDAHAPLAS